MVVAGQEGFLGRVPPVEAGRHCTVQSITPLPWAGRSGLMHLNHLGACAALTHVCPFQTMKVDLPEFLFGGQYDTFTAPPFLSATVYQKDATMATPATREVKRDLFLVLVLSEACGLVG